MKRVGYYLMIKEAESLKMRYLCKCIDTKDHLSYRGSGVYWRRLLNKYNPEITTIVLGHYDTNEELRVAGEFYSKKFNVVEDPTWANLMPEVGDGGPTVQGRVRGINPITGETRTFETLDQIPQDWIQGCVKGYKKPIHAKEASRLFHTGRVRSSETRLRMVQSVRKKRMTVSCPICQGQITPQNIKRHQEKCEG